MLYHPTCGHADFLFDNAWQVCFQIFKRMSTCSLLVLLALSVLCSMGTMGLRTSCSTMRGRWGSHFQTQFSMQGYTFLKAWTALKRAPCCASMDTGTLTHTHTTHTCVHTQTYHSSHAAPVGTGSDVQLTDRYPVPPAPPHPEQGDSGACVHKPGVQGEEVTLAQLLSKCTESAETRALADRAVEVGGR